jgi:hypothetical protein
LDQWISYLSDANEPYPIWFRYYAFRNILNLGDYDKDKGEFTKRSAGSARLFPDIDRGALAHVEEMIEAARDPEMLERLQNAQRAAANGDVPPEERITKEKAERFAKLSFAKQYAQAIGEAGEITPEMRAETRGRWVTYQQGTDPTALWASLQNKGTAWCTKGFGTAETQLQGGDFHVYYTLDRQGKPTIPRIAIRMSGGAGSTFVGHEIGEVRGVADNDQNLEENMAEIADEKMNTLPGVERYRKASSDTKMLAAIRKKVESHRSLTKTDLIFLYEIHGPVQGFGYQQHPRVKELRSQRNPMADMLVVFDCEQKQIARSLQEVNEFTKVYVGPLSPGIFKLLGHVEHVYTSFPEGRITRYNVEIGGQTEQQLEKALERAGFKISDYARHMMRQKEFKAAKDPEQADLVRLTVGDLFGDKNVHTTNEIYEKADQLGLELCPAEVGPHLRLKLKDQPMGDWFRIAMKQIAGPDRDPRVFGLGHRDDGMWLYDRWTGPSREWDPGHEFVFRLRPRK